MHFILMIMALMLIGPSAAFSADLDYDRFKTQIDCLDFLNRYENFTLITENTASKSIKWFANRKPVSDHDVVHNVFMKIYEGNIKELNYEGIISNTHARFLLDNKRTPHIASGLGFYLCREKASELKEYFRRLAHGDFRKKIDAWQDDSKISIIISERVGSEKNPSMSFKDFLTNEPIDDRFATNLRGLLFQIYFTMAEFKKFGLFHGDLHTGNIMIERSPLDAIYRISDELTVRIQSDFTAKLIDFDRSCTSDAFTLSDERIPRLVGSPRYSHHGFEKYGHCVWDTNFEISTLIWQAKARATRTYQSGILDIHSVLTSEENGLTDILASLVNDKAMLVNSQSLPRYGFVSH